jgi:hypothetical protein
MGYGGTRIDEISRRKKLFGGQKEQLLQVIVVLLADRTCRAAIRGRCADRRAS